jgi:tetratricopeptide (TPR) repeat protein
MPVIEPVEYDACLDRVEDSLPQLVKTWEEERSREKEGAARARKGWGLLTPSERRLFQGRWSEVEILLDLSFSLRYSSPAAMRKLALSALDAAERLNPSSKYPEPLVYDLRARAAMELANAERVNEKFLQAEEAFEKARSYAGSGTGDLVLEAMIDEFEASLRKAQRRFEQADALLAGAFRIYLKFGEDHLAGRALIARAVNRGIGERAREGVALLTRAVELLAQGDPQLLAVAEHNLIDALVDAGDALEASRLYLKSNLRVIFKDDPLNLIRLRWLEGKISGGRQRFDDAEKVLAGVRDEFRALGLEYVAAIAGLDLAKVLLAQGKHEELQALSVELVVRARAKRIHLGARDALRCFEIMCRHGAATAHTTKLLQRFLKDSERRPRLRFEPEHVIGHG